MKSQTEKGFCRRDFLKLAVAAGIVSGCGAAQEALPTATQPPAVEPTLPPANTPTVKPSAIPTFSVEDFARMSYCGIRCWSACPETSYPSLCEGCKAQGGKQAAYNAVCPVRKCASQKQVLTCAHCDEYDTCKQDTWTLYPGLRTKIERIREYLKTS